MAPRDPVGREGPDRDGTPGEEQAGSGTSQRLWGAIRLDVLVLLFAAGALTVNLVSPDALSPGLSPLLFLAAAWVAYRIYQKVTRHRQ